MLRWRAIRRELRLCLAVALSTGTHRRRRRVSHPEVGVFPLVLNCELAPLCIRTPGQLCRRDRGNSPIYTSVHGLI